MHYFILKYCKKYTYPYLPHIWRGKNIILDGLRRKIINYSVEEYYHISNIVD